MIKATKQAEKISVLLHSSSCHVFFNDEVCSSTKYDPKSPNGILKNPKPRQLEMELNIILKQRELRVLELHSQLITWLGSKINTRNAAKAS